MARKKKKFDDEWAEFIHKLTTRKRNDRKYTVPMDYIIALADSIHAANPTKGILINTLKDFYCICFERCYDRFIADNKFRKDKEEQHFEEDWNKFKDEVDDIIHLKNIKV